MNRAVKVRLMSFALAIVVAALMIGWAAHTTWLKVEQLSARLTRVQIESFQTANQFRANLQGLDGILLLYQSNHNPRERDRFLEDWRKMDTWIDVQRPLLTTEREGVILDKINAAYDDYYAAATNLLSRIEHQTSATQFDKEGFDRVDAQSKRLRNLGDDLIEAHRQSLSQFLDDSRRALFYLRGLIFGSLLVMLVLVGWLAVVVYNEMIFPLRMKLVESREIIERQEKLASLGVLAAGVAHEVRNPLTAIKARLFTLQKHLAKGSSESETAGIIGGEINRLERIVRDFLQFARPSEPTFVKTSMGATLEEIKSLLEASLEKRGIQLKLEPVPQAEVRIDAQQIKQVLINLIQNGADSIEGKGSITLRVLREERDLAGARRPVVITEITDTGKGIPPEVEKRLFDPFFTTKETGTGLGLSIAARIVEKHGGILQYQTVMNHGTTFGIVLPYEQLHETTGKNTHR